MTDLGNLKGFELNREAHKFDDVDKSREAHHHTIGEGENQAASGAKVKALEDAKLATHTWHDDGSTDTTLTDTTVVDIGGLTLDVVVEAETDVFLVVLNVAAINNNNDAISLFAFLTVNGVLQGVTIRFFDSTTGAIVLNGTRTWIITGLDPGTVVFKAQGNLSGAGSWIIDGSESALSVVRLNG